VTAGPPPELEQVVRSRKGRQEGDEIRFQCPFPGHHNHGDADPSARYNPAKGVWRCYACGESGGWEGLWEQLGLPRIERNPSPIREIAATYSYRDIEGKLLFEVVRRSNPKGFLQRRPDGAGGWLWKLNGTPRVLYRLPEIAAAIQQGRTIYLVEGEKDADNLVQLGLPATTNPGGAGKWRVSYSDSLRGAHVAILPDNDPPGRQHAEMVARALSGIAIEVGIVELPDLPAKGDVSDWIAAQRHATVSDSRAELERLTLAALPWTAQETDPCRCEPEGVSCQATLSPREVQDVLSDLKALPPTPDLDIVQKHLGELTQAACGLERLQVAILRERALQALSGKVNTPARLVDAALAGLGGGRAESEVKQGKALDLTSPIPWEEPVSGATVLDEIERAFIHYVALPEGAAPALALWVLRTHAHEASDVSPLLALTSPEKRCGKTTTLSVLAAVVPRPLPASNITPSALFRAVEKYSPTLLVDEADSFLRDREELRGILNSGHTRSSAYVVRTVGDDHEVRSFSTWAPKALALIGDLPSTLSDRSIVIPMRRKTASERVARLRLDRLSELADLPRRAARWAGDHMEELRRAEPEVPAELHDRAADNWRSLLAIADLAGEDWPDKARRAAVFLSGGGTAEDSSIRVKLLADLREAFQARGTDRLPTRDLLNEIRAREDRPWAEWKHGKPLSASDLARLLKDFGVKPQKIRIGEEVLQGYLRDTFEDVFRRYLPANPEHPEQTNEISNLGLLSTRNTTAAVPTREQQEKPSSTRVVPGVPDRTGVFSETAGGTDDPDDWGDL
jgi:hypothetical protein